MPALRRIRRTAAHGHGQNPQKRTARPSARNGSCPMTATGFENITVAREASYAVVTLNRPQRRNALSLELMRELTACLDQIGRDREIRAVVLAAAGKVFCSGHDLAEMTGRNINEYREIFDVCT